MKLEHTDAGLQVIGKLYKDMNIETEWSCISERGFTWFGCKFAQRVWAEDPYEDQGILITKIHSETNYLRYPNISPEVEYHLATGMRYATLNGPVIQPDSESIKMSCSAYVHEENQEWLSALFSLAVAIQYTEVFNTAEKLAPLMDLERDYSPHPTSGYREQSHEILTISDLLGDLRKEGAINNIPKGIFWEIGEEFHKRDLLYTADDRSLTAYIPFANNSALFQVSTAVRHPGLGEGVLFLLTLPPDEIAHGVDINPGLIMRMNLCDNEASETGHFLGSWCLGTGRDDHPETPVFVTFIPAVACTPNVIVNMVFSTLGHCHWAEKVYFKDQINSQQNLSDMSQDDDEDEKISIQAVETAIDHVIEDICPTCPIDALRTLESYSNLKTCDPHEYKGNCGLAELRSHCLTGGKEVV